MKKIKILEIRTDGTSIPHEVDEDDFVERCQKIVGGYIEVVGSLSGEDSYVVNEDGRMLGLEPNPFIAYPGGLVGNVVVVDLDEIP